MGSTSQPCTPYLSVTGYRPSKKGVTLGDSGRDKRRPKNLTYVSSFDAPQLYELLLFPLIGVRGTQATETGRSLPEIGWQSSGRARI